MGTYSCTKLLILLSLLSSILQTYLYKLRNIYLTSVTAQFHQLPILICLKDIEFVNHLQILGVLESRVAMVLSSPTTLQYNINKNIT